MYIPEHCGHGRSYRLVEDPSLVHVDSYKRYVADLLFVARTAKKEHKNLKLYLFGHSMGGGIAAAAVAAKPKLFERLVLSSPMIRPLSGKVPWHDARTMRQLFVKQGRQSGMWQDRSLTVDREGLKIVRPPQEFAMNIIGQRKRRSRCFR